MDTVPDVPLPASNDLASVGEWACRILDSFGLHDWSFQFTRARRTLGVCRYGPRIIGLSIHLVQRNGPEEIRETLLHEIAHALVGPGRGHGPAWREMARRIGCQSVRCGTADMPPGRWRADCGSCGRRYRRHRRPRRMAGWFCRLCGRERGKLTWAVDG
jgi:predicted SprT family Zn-dependent metalloprotease